MRSYLFLIALAGLFLCSCSYEEVELVQVNSVDFNEFGEKGISITANVQISNPNNYNVNIVDSDIDLFLANQPAGKAKLVEKVTIPGNSNMVHQIHFDADLSEGKTNLIPVFLTAVLSNSINVEAKGYVKARTFIFSKKIEFSHKEKVDIRNR